MSTQPAARAVVVRHLNATVERVFDAWLDRRQIGQWMFGPPARDEEIVHLYLDPHVGGTFSFLVERQGTRVEHLGKYLELVRPERLVFTWMVEGEPVGSRVTVIVKPAAGGAELTVVHELHPSWAEHVDAIKSSWSNMLDVLARLLESPGEPPAVSPK